MKSDEIFQKLKKNFSKILIFGLLVIGVLLAIDAFSSKKPDVAEEISGWSEKLEIFLESMEGVGECEVLIYPSSDENTEPEIVGICIVCQGDSSVVKSAVTEAVTTLFGIDVSRISISRKS